MEQIANLSTGNRRQGSNPCLSALTIPIAFKFNVLGIFCFLLLRYLYGYPNSVDAFPDDATEWSDLDNDGIGDNIDMDLDGDGFSNLVEATCFTDQSDPFDLPGDFDGDGIPNCFDEDDDNDLYLDVDEISCSSNPLDKEDKPLDTDNDMIPNCIDPDDDNDGYPDDEVLIT